MIEIIVASPEMVTVVAVCAGCVGLLAGVHARLNRKDKELEEIKQTLRECNRKTIISTQRYVHLKQYYVELANKFTLLKVKYGKVKSKLYELAEVHFGEEIVNDVVQCHDNSSDSSDSSPPPKKKT
jgi:hypothetical protein